MVYIPAPKSPTYWTLQSGKRAAVLTFTDNGIPTQITPAWMKERYGDPTLTTGLPWGEHRFPLDPQKGIIASLIAAAAKTNLHGISLPSPSANPMTATVQAMDIVATLTPDGEDSEIFKQVELDASGGVGGGYSQDRFNPQLVSLPNPPYGLGKFQMGGRTFWQLNVHPLSPDNFLRAIAPRNVNQWLRVKGAEDLAKVTNQSEPLRLFIAPGVPVPTPTPASAPSPGDHSDHALDLGRVEEAAARVRRVLPDPGKGGAPLQRLADEVRKLLAVIDGAAG